MLSLIILQVSEDLFLMTAFCCLDCFMIALRIVLVTNIPVDTGRKLNVRKTFRRRPVRLLKVLCTFSVRPVSTRYLMIISNIFLFHRSMLIQSGQKCIKKFLENYLSWLISVLKHFWIVLYKIYIFYWTKTKCRAKYCTDQTMAIKNASLDSRWIKKLCLFVYIEIIDTWVAWAFETCLVFNEMIQFTHITQVLYIFIIKWHIKVFR